MTHNEKDPTGSDSPSEASNERSILSISRRDFFKTTGAGLGIIGGGVGMSGTAAAANGINTPRLHVDGNWLKDPNGNEVVLRGVNTDGPLFADQYDNKTVQEKIEMATTGDWYARVIRLPCERDRVNNEADGDVQWYAENYIDPAINKCEDQGVYAIIDWHAGAEWDDSSVHNDLTDFWDVVAPRYANREHVLYEVFNEPTYPGEDSLENWKDWRSTAQPWINSIRNDAPDTPIIIGSPVWCQHTKYADDAPFSGGDLIYAAHIYPTHFDGGVDMSELASTSQNVPVMITEWGYVTDPDEADHMQGTTSGYGQDMKDWLTNNPSISWTSWCFARRYGPVFFDQEWNLLGGEDYQGEFQKDFLYEERNNDVPESGSGGGDTTAPTAPSNLSSPDKDSSSVDLDWDASSDDGGSGLNHYHVYVDGSKDHGIAAGTTSTTVSGLSSDTSYDFHVTAVDGADNESGDSNTVSVTTDSGSTGGNAFSISGAGWDGWDDDDGNEWSAFHWAHESTSGDATLVAQVTGLTTDGDAYDVEAAGIHLQGSTGDGDAAGAAILVENGPSGLEETFWSKDSSGVDGTRSGTTNTSLPRWLKLERAGDTVTGYVSSDGSSWSEVGSATLSNIPTDAYIGLGMTSGENTLQTADFDNVSGLDSWNNTDLGGASPDGSVTEN